MLIPALLRIPLAVWRDFIFPSTVSSLFVIGLYQISWSPLPRRLKVQPLCVYQLITWCNTVYRNLSMFRIFRFQQIRNCNKNSVKQIIKWFIFQNKPGYIFTCCYPDFCFIIPKKVLAAYGYNYKRQKGSHKNYLNDKGDLITLKDPLKISYINEILERIGEK